MKDRRNLPQNKVDLKKMKIAIKKTSLMIDELDLKEEEEMEFRLTTEEQNRYVMLKDVFKNNRYPSHDIKSAIEDEHRLKNIRKDYLAASKVQIERKNIKDSLSNDSVGTILLASGAPVMLIGAMLLDTFIVAGIGVIAVGVAMTMPMFLKEITQKRTAKKRLKQINNRVGDLSGEIYRRSCNIDHVCTRYGIPINCTDREKYMVPLCDAAVEFECLSQKELDYELLVKMHGTDVLRNQIASNLQTLSGLPVNGENEFHDIMDIIEKQFEITSSQFMIEDKEEEESDEKIII